jgi:hypothetical protein
MGRSKISEGRSSSTKVIAVLSWIGRRFVSPRVGRMSLALEVPHSVSPLNLAWISFWEKWLVFVQVVRGTPALRCTDSKNFPSEPKKTSRLTSLEFLQVRVMVNEVHPGMTWDFVTESKSVEFSVLDNLFTNFTGIGTGSGIKWIAARSDGAERTGAAGIEGGFGAPRIGGEVMTGGCGPGSGVTGTGDDTGGVGPIGFGFGDG